MTLAAECATAPAAFVSAPPCPVLVLRLGRYMFHHGSVGITRTLGVMGIPVYQIVEDRFTPAALSRYLSGSFTWDTSGLTTERLLDGMAAIGARLNRPTILIPTDDAAAIFIAEQAEILRRWFVFPTPPPALYRTLANKRQLYALCRRLELPCPDYVFPDCTEDVEAFVARARFPVVVKVAESWRLPKGVLSTTIARTPEQLVAIYDKAERANLANLIFQDYIPGDCSEDWFFHGYSNPVTGCMIGFTGRKLRSYPAFAGFTTLGQYAANDRLQAQAEALLRETGYAGIMDLDFRLDKRDGQYKLLDFNPRIGMQFRLFEDSAGLDVARALYLDLTGCRVRRGPPEIRSYVVEPYDLAASFTYLWNRKMTVRAWWRSLQGRHERAWLDRRDILPCLILYARLFLKAVTRALPVGRGGRLKQDMPQFRPGRGRSPRLGAI